MINIGLERIVLQARIWIDGYLRMQNQEAAVTELTPIEGTLNVYARPGTDGISHLYYRDDDDVEHDMSGGTVVNNTTVNNTTIVQGGGGDDHLHGLAHWLGDGTLATFELPDFAEYVEVVTDDGVVIDPKVYSLSGDRTQVVFDAAPDATSVLLANYVVARL